MAVYVDRIRHYRNVTGVARRYGGLWSHMMADTTDELHTMADLIGISRKWFQDRHSFPHYDITPPKRARAVRLGAVEIDTTKILLRMMKANENR